MKVIVTGSTGYIGKGVLEQCLSHPSITKVVALSRRPLVEESNPKLQVILMEHFDAYTDDTIAELVGADACIWCLGTYNGDADVEIGFPTAFAAAMTKTFSEDRKSPFRYIHLGGALTESDQGKSLWYLQAARRGRGLGETTVMKFADPERNPTGLWETYVAKPGGVASSKWTGFLSYILGPNLYIQLDELAATMIEVGLNGSEEGVLSNKVLRERGQKLLSERMERDKGVTT